MLSSWNKVIIIIIVITETAIYKDRRGLTNIHKGYGAYPLHVVLFCFIFVCYFTKIPWMVFKLWSGHYFVTKQLLTNTNGHLKDRRTLTVYVWGCRFTCKNRRDHLKL